MNVFYYPELTEGSHFLPEEESWHATKVFRLRRNDEIKILDGKGHICIARISDPHPKNTAFDPIDLKHIRDIKNWYIHIAIAPTKQMERLEIFLEKVTEIGIDEITLIFSANSERTQIRHERVEKILIAALKQSQQPYLPKLNSAVRLNDFHQNIFRYDQKFIAHCKDLPKESFVKLVQPGKSVCILIGPEGDFTREEIQDALNFGYHSVSMGEQRFRTETAGIVACHTIYLLNQLNGL